MKKTLLLSGLIILSLSVFATRHVVQVANFQFSPANLTNVFVGDTIRWVWASGFHTTTCNPATQGPDNSLPAGAATWNSDINPSVTAFEYKVTVAGTYNYWCVPHQPNMAGSFTAAAALPVKLTSFLVAGNNEKASLTWITENEENTDHFSVRRSVDGTNYAEIATIPAAGNSRSIKNYSFNDSKLSPGQKFYYYNIAVVDLDGKQIVSETKLFKNLKGISSLILSLSPNPISSPGHLNLKFNAEKEGKMDVRLISSDGKIIKATVMQAYTGVNNGHFHLGILPAGTYTLVCTIDGLTESYHLVYKP
ncbi:MAG TPA: plastocyanin/azurin family copper-binding protein [Segetibacter sp.]